MAVHVPLPADSDLPEAVRERLAALPPLNVFRMMANAPASFPALIDFAWSILFQSELDAREREIAILRVARATRSDYEWKQHVVVAAGVGVTSEEIAAIAEPEPGEALDETGKLLCRVADEISLDVRLSDEALAALLERYGRRQTTELILCVSYFNMVSRFLESTRTELEATNVLDRIS